MAVAAVNRLLLRSLYTTANCTPLYALSTCNVTAFAAESVWEFGVAFAERVAYANVY